MSSQPSSKVFCVHTYGPSWWNVPGWAGEVLHHTQPFISARHAGSHPTPAAIMPHQAGQVPALAAEQGARASLKIKCTASGLHSQERGGLTLYWLHKFPSKYHKQQQPGRWWAVPAQHSPGTPRSAQAPRSWRLSTGWAGLWAREEWEPAAPSDI